MLDTEDFPITRLVSTSVCRHLSQVLNLITGMSMLGIGLGQSSRRCTIPKFKVSSYGSVRLFRVLTNMGALEDVSRFELATLHVLSTLLRYQHL